MAATLTLGSTVSTAREYVVLELCADDGRSGVAVGYTRGTPLLEALRVLCRALDPQIGMNPEEVQADLFGRFAVGWASLIRAASLVDIALWDLAEIPLAAGRGRATSPGRTPAWMMVAGYFPDLRGVGELVTEAMRFVDDGASIVKVMLDGIRHDRDLALVAELRVTLPSETLLGVDFHGTCRDVDDALRRSADFANLGVSFIEDPFPGHPLPMLNRLVDGGCLPLAVGEDMVEEWMVSELLGIARHLRIDATASGGLTVARRAAAAATAAGVGVMPHVFPATHALLSGHARVEALELIPAYVGSDPIDQLLRTGRPHDAPLSFDWHAVQRFAVDDWTETFTEERLT